METCTRLPYGSRSTGARYEMKVHGYWRTLAHIHIETTRNDFFPTVRIFQSCSACLQWEVRISSLFYPIGPSSFFFPGASSILCALGCLSSKSHRLKGHSTIFYSHVRSINNEPQWGSRRSEPICMSKYPCRSICLQSFSSFSLLLLPHPHWSKNMWWRILFQLSFRLTWYSVRSVLPLLILLFFILLIRPKTR